jgi:hypothetical protein
VTSTPTTEDTEDAENFFQYSSSNLIAVPAIALSPFRDNPPELTRHAPCSFQVRRKDMEQPVFAAQMLTYLRITKLRVGLLLNFNRTVLKDGIKRFLL